MARKSYNEEFKIAAAKLVREQGYSVRKAAESLGVDQGSIHGWVRKFAPEAVAPEPDAPPEALRREVLRLREENRRLLMEREVLPLNASIARPSFSPDLPPKAVPMHPRT